MKLRRVITKAIDRDERGLNVKAAVQAVVVANVNEPEGERAERDKPEGEEAPHE